MKRKYPSEAEAKAKAYAIRAKAWAANAANAANAALRAAVQNGGHVEKRVEVEGISPIRLSWGAAWIPLPNPPPGISERARICVRSEGAVLRLEFSQTPRYPRGAFPELEEYARKNGELEEYYAAILASLPAPLSLPPRP